MKANRKKKDGLWIPEWGPTLPGVLTLHDVGGGWSALRHGSDENSYRIGIEEHERLVALFASAPRVVLAACAEPGMLDELSRAHSVANRMAGRELSSPLLEWEQAEGPVRWLAGYASSFVFGCGTLTVHSHERLELDLVDNDCRYCGGTSLQPDTSAEITTHAIDEAMGPLLQDNRAPVEGPYLVLTGLHAAELREHGGLPFSDIPDLLHHGLVELWRASQMRLMATVVLLRVTPLPASLLGNAGRRCYNFS